MVRNNKRHIKIYWRDGESEERDVYGWGETGNFVWITIFEEDGSAITSYLPLEKIGAIHEQHNPDRWRSEETD